MLFFLARSLLLGASLKFARTWTPLPNIPIIGNRRPRTLSKASPTQRVSVSTRYPGNDFTRSCSLAAYRETLHSYRMSLLHSECRVSNPPCLQLSSIQCIQTCGRGTFSHRPSGMPMNHHTTRGIDQSLAPCCRGRLIHRYVGCKSGVLDQG